MKTLEEFENNTQKDHGYIYLSFSTWRWLLLSPAWYCEVWLKDDLQLACPRGKKTFGFSYGRSKFEAYRKALYDLTSDKVTIATVYGYTIGGYEI